MPSSPHRSRTPLHLSLIMATSLLAWAPSLFGYFLSDDFNVVTLLNRNRTAVDWPNVLSDFYTVYRGDLTYSYYRPMITLSGGIDLSLWGFTAAGPHLTNMILNALNGGLVYGIAARPPISSPAVGLTAALLFALHPLHPEAVYWLVGRTELIMACFALLAILLYLVYTDRNGRLPYLGSLLSFALALGSKETAVVVPVALTWYHLMLRHSGRTRPALPPAASLLPYYLLLGAYFGLRKALTGHVIGQYGPMGVNPSDPFLMSLGLGRLFLCLLFPAGSLLTPAGDAVIGDTARRLLGLIPWLSAAVVAVIAMAGSRRRTVPFCLGLTVIFAMPVLSVLAVWGSPDLFSRLYYLPSAAFCLLIGVLLDNSRGPVRRYGTPILLLASASLLAVNSLPWIQAGRIARTILAQIGQTADEPGARAVLVIGNPDFHFGAELFGEEGWALPIAAAPPFVTVPPSVRILHHPGNPCAPLRDGLIQRDDKTVILAWDRAAQRLTPLTWDRLTTDCSTGR